MTDPTQPKPFTVLIAGGSITGLTLALLLERAGINYTLLERGPSMAPQIGAALGLHPHTVGILDQLGLWEDDIKPIAIPMRRGKHYTIEGELYETTKNFEMISKRMGYPVVFVERQLYLETVMKHLSEDGKKNRIHTSASVADVEQDNEGVTVTTVDGRSFRGDILIGADGVHSKVRDLISMELQKDLKAEYNCVFGISKMNATTPIEPGTALATYDVGVSLGCFHAVAGKTFWFLFKKADGGVTYAPNVPRYTEKDTKVLIERYADMPASPEFSLRNLYDLRETAVLVALEEGVVKQWIDGRTLLVGDSAHKFTINAGLGGNIVIESAVHLANRLQALLAHTPHPSPVEITALYKDFESVQRPRAHQALGISASATRIEAHATWLYKLASRYVLPLLGDSVKVSYFEGVGVSSPDVEYIPKKAGRLRDLKAERDRKRRKTSGVVQLVKVAAAASLFGWVLEQYGGAYRLAPAMKAIQSLIGRS